MMNITLPTIIARRAPYRSPNDPAIGETSAVTMLDSAYAIVIDPWLQPNSSVRGSIKTPKAIRIDEPTICITAMIDTMTQA